ncbi:MAG: hypothetical protein PHW60_09405 [Kiritimatiellae bacterium]|nr:hypothetical protein [Kiritimatiellia bacterium]
MKPFQVTVTLPAPSAEKVKVFYPDGMTDVTFERNGEAVSFEARRLTIHDMLVVEWLPNETTMRQ